MEIGEKIYVADKATLDKIYDAVSADGIYGFVEHCAVPSPTERIEYIGMNKSYIPLTVNKTTHEVDYGSWGDFPVIVGNKPYMVKADGTPDYRLNENDYTKREDGTASDVSNTSYNGGAFAWIPKIYKQEYMLGNDRIVKFSMRPRDGFKPVGFVDPDGNELEGVWIPMFYGSIVGEKMRSIAGVQPDYSKTTDAQNTAISALSTRAKFFGGSIINTLTDLLIMFGKSTNSQEVYGAGNMIGYDASLTPTMGVKQNAVIGGGQFYGSSDGKSLNKIFHSIALGSWQQWMRDPYTLCVNGRYKISPNYVYDLTGATYQDTGISIPANVSAVYPDKFRTIPGFGAVPVYPYNGTSALGGCDGFWVNVAITAVALRFGNCSDGAFDGLRALSLSNSAAGAGWYIGAAILLLPPVGVAA